MITFYDYLPSQNGWKIRQLLRLTGQAYHHVLLDLFGGEGQNPDFLAINPSGKVPAIRLGDGRCLAESSAILVYLAEGTPWLPGDAFDRAKVLQWLSFEQEQIESVIGSLRYWRLTGKLAARSPELLAAKRAAGQRSLTLLERELAQRGFIAGEAFTVADIALYGYAARAEDAGFDLHVFPHFRRWCARVEAQPGFLAERYAYAIDPKALAELP